jgi:hypothetical protein
LLIDVHESVHRSANARPWVAVYPLKASVILVLSILVVLPLLQTVVILSLRVIAFMK